MFATRFLRCAWLLCGALALAFAGCSDDDHEQVETSEESEVELPDPAGCPPGDSECQDKFLEAYGCFPFNGRWEGEWQVTGGTIGGSLVGVITMDGCQGGGSAVFEDAPCFSSADIEAVAEGQNIGGRVVGVERGNPIDVFLDGSGSDTEINLEFEVIEGTFCAGLKGTIVLHRQG